MATFETYRTAKTAKRCDDYPRCQRGIQPGERYLRATATPRDMDVNPGDRWRTLNVCCEHMRPEPATDPYDRPVFIQGHRHSEPVCAWPDCRTYLTREQMAELPNA